MEKFGDRLEHGASHRELGSGERAIASQAAENCKDRWQTSRSRREGGHRLALPVSARGSPESWACSLQDPETVNPSSLSCPGCGTRLQLPRMEDRSLRYLATWVGPQTSGTLLLSIDKEGVDLQTQGLGPPGKGSGGSSCKGVHHRADARPIKPGLGGSWGAKDGAAEGFKGRPTHAAHPFLPFNPRPSPQSA